MKRMTSRHAVSKVHLGVILAASLLRTTPAYSQGIGIGAGPLGPGPIAYIPLGSTGAVAGINLNTYAVLAVGLCPVTPKCAPQEPPRQGSGPGEVAARPFGPAAYASNRDSALGSTDPFAVVSPLLGGQIPIGSGQFGIKLGPDLTPAAPFLYVVNALADVIETVAGVQTTVTGYAISVIDTTLVVPTAPMSDAVVSVIQTDVSPAELAFTSDGGTLYVTHTGSNHVWAVNPLTGAQIASIDVGNRTQGIATVPLSADALGILPSAYVTVPTANAVAVIDIATNTLIGMIPVGRNPFAVAVNAVGDTAYVANSADGSVSVIGTANNTVTGVIPVGLNPSSIGYDPTTGQVIVLNSGSGTVSIINAAMGVVVATVPVALNDVMTPAALTGMRPMDSSGGSSGSGGIAIGLNGDGGAEPLLYASQFDGSVAAAGLYTETPQPSKTIPASFFSGPAITPGLQRQMAYDPFNKLIWYSAVSGQADQIRSVDPVTGLPGVVMINALPGQPVGFRRQVYIDYGGQRLMTPNNDGSVSLFNLATGTAAGTIPASFFTDNWTGYGFVRCFASDPRTGNAWYAAADGSFREFSLSPVVAPTGRVILLANQIGGQQTVVRRFIIDPKLNELIYEVNASEFAGYTLASLSLTTLRSSGHAWGPGFPSPFTPISLVNVDQCQLTTSAEPFSGGSVITSPSSHGNGYFDCGSKVTVRGIAKAGYQFTGFSGDLSGSGNGQAITMDAAKSIAANFTPAESVTVTVSPSSVTLAPGQTQQFSALVANASTTAVAWSIDSGPGTILANGLYSAPSQVTSGQSAVIRATSLADVTRSGSATIQISAQLTSIAIKTNPTGLTFSVDNGAVQIAPQTLSLTTGMHTIAVAAAQASGAGVQNVFASWSDAGAAAHQITVGTSAAAYTANFTTQYQLTISASPTTGGTVTPSAGGFYNSGTVVPVTAIANSGNTFTSWTGGVASPSSNSTSVTMTAPQTLTANFSSSASGPPAFFTGEVSLGSGVYYLQFPNGNLFGYYNLANFPIFYHYDMGFEAFISSGNAAAYMYDFSSGHWWYTSPSLFPYLYDFTLNNWLYYFPDTKTPGHYTTDPRVFSDVTTGKIITM